MLSERLQTIADRIEEGEVVADIGTDHGLLPIYLCRENRCRKVIMTDISEDSLAKAKTNGAPFLRSGAAAEGQKQDPTDLDERPTTPLEARVGDGLIPLEEGEADTVVMAGIGGNLMIKILEKDPPKSFSMGRYILQPRRAPGELRRYLHEKGYRMESEILVREGKFLWEIMVVRPPEKGNAAKALENKAITRGEWVGTSQEPESILLWEVPSYFGELDDSLMNEYLERKIAREKRNLKGKQKASIIDEEAVAKSEANIAYLTSLLNGRR